MISLFQHSQNNHHHHRHHLIPQTSFFTSRYNSADSVTQCKIGQLSHQTTHGGWMDGWEWWNYRVVFKIVVTRPVSTSTEDIFNFPQCTVTGYGTIQDSTMVFSWGDWGVPPSRKILPPFPQPTAVPTFWPEPVPPSEFCPWKFQKFYLIFLSILTTF